jgi:hypothetical protein
MENENGKSEKKFWGVVVYEIVDSCLNGLWTNNDPQKGGVLMNEIARKIDESGGNIIGDYERKNDKKREEIIGDYHVSWIEPNEEPTTGKLKITPKGIDYNFEWRVKGEVIFKGIGMLVGLKQLVAFYWKTDETFFI